MKIRAIITGTTGMVGEGVLHECLNDNDVEAVLVINRKPCGYTHPKLKEIIHADFFNVEPIAAELAGYNACFFCLGVSSVGMDEPTFTKFTHTLTLHVAGVLSRQNPEMTFCYISGGGTDSTEKGRLMWARVKGKTENDLKKLPFKKVYAFRPGIMKPTPGLKNTLKAYKYFGWLYGPVRTFFPGAASTLAELGLSMIAVVKTQPEQWIWEVRDFVQLAKRHAV
jgi:hypothetical protein